MKEEWAIQRIAREANVFPDFVRAIALDFPYLKIPAAAFVIAYLTSCATISSHPFAEPTNDWQMRTGQLLYRTAKTTIIGDVIVRFSKNGDFELTFSKGPGVILLALQQDATTARATGSFARTGWSGPVDRAPAPLQGWLQLREKLIHAGEEKSVHVTTGAETFLFRF